MNEERLLEHYARIADVPDTVARLRRFIVDLAVRGKLVPQDAGDEPASELMSKVIADVNRRRKAGDFKEPSSFVQLDRKALPFTPARHWEWVKLINIVQPSYGFAFPSAQFNTAKRGLPLIRIRDISNPDAEAYFDGEFDAYYIVEAGDYLVGMDGDFNLRRWRGPKGLLNQRVLRLNGWRCGISSEFVRLPLQAILQHLHGETSLTTVKHLSAKQVNGIDIPLPPLAEQHRIVAKVDELMALCDRLEAARERREATRDRLAVASLARLNAPDPETFAADARFALATLPALTTRPDQIKQLRQTILNLALRGAFSEKDNWQAKPLQVGDVLKLQNGYAFKSEWFADQGVRLLRNANVSHGEVNWDDKVHLPISQAAEFQRFSLQEGDVVLSLDRPFIATGLKVARVSKADLPALLLQRVGRFVLSERIKPAFLLYWLNSAQFASQIDPGRSNGVPHISSKQVEAAKLFLPPLAEQHRIVAKVDTLMALCDRLEANLTAAAATRRRLLDALLAEALAPAADRLLEAAE